jgi:hypothetical protein
MSDGPIKSSKRPLDPIDRVSEARGAQGGTAPHRRRVASAVAGVRVHSAAVAGGEGGRDSSRPMTAQAVPQ